MNRPNDTFVRCFLFMNPAEDNNVAFADRKCTALPGHQQDMHRGSFKAVGEINDWLRNRGFTGAFDYLNYGHFGLASGNLDPNALLLHLHMLPWLHPADVQIMIKTMDKSRYELFELKLDYFEEVQEFLNSQDAQKPDVRKMIEDAVILEGNKGPKSLRRIRRDIGDGDPRDPGEPAQPAASGRTP